MHNDFMVPLRAAPTRRAMLRALAGLALTGAMACSRRSGAAAAAAESDTGPVLIARFDAGGHSQGVERVDKLVRSEADWRAQLSPLAFEVTRREGTEPAYSGALWNHHADGLYHCVCCETALFDSRTKYDSGTGWPSFWRALSAHNVVERADDSLAMTRTAVSCRRCDAHLGHVFDDGPQPTGLRYCMNSVALHFAPRA